MCVYVIVCRLDGTSWTDYLKVYMFYVCAVEAQTGEASKEQENPPRFRVPKATQLGLFMMHV